MEPIDINSLPDELTDEKLKPVKLIVIGLNAGVFLVFLAAMILYFRNLTGTVSVNVNSDLYDILLFILTLITALMLYASKVVPEKLFGKGSTDLVSSINSFYILKLALLEIAVFPGLVIFIMSIINSIIYYNPFLWAAIIPILMFFFVSLANFPNNQNVINLVKEITAKKII